MRLQFRVAPAAAAVLLSTIAAVHAVSTEHPPSRFDGRFRGREGGAISVDPRPVESLAATDPLRRGWETFRARHGGSGAWSVYLDERTGLPTLVSGRGITWLSDEAAAAATLDEIEALARAFLQENAALLGDWSGILELDRAASLLVREGQWQLVFRQNVNGVRVENARLDLHVVRGRMVLFGAHFWGRLGKSGIPAVGAEVAGDFLREYIGADAAGLQLAAAPELTLIAVAADGEAGEGEPRPWSGARGAGLSHLLVWRFLLDEADAPVRWVGEVDAHDGTVRAFYEGTRYGTVRGGAFPVSPDGDCVAGGCELPWMPVPFVDYTETGQAERFADTFGNLVCTDPGAAVVTNLAGSYVRIVDACGAMAESGTCSEGVELGLKYGENCAVAPGASAGNTAAARSSYYHINRIAEIARFYNASNSWLRNPLTVNVNLTTGDCNANWNMTSINMNGDGKKCRNSGENAGVLVHEWGHGYDDNDGGGADRPSEAYSDIVAILTTHDSCVGRGLYKDGTMCGPQGGYGDTCLNCTGIRDMDWNARASKTPATPTNFASVRCETDYSAWGGPCRREPHCESYVVSEAMFDLATRDLPASGMDQDSAWQVVERLWYQTRPGSGGEAYTCVPSSNSCGSTSWYQRMRVADDDNGNLANGTPHAAALFAAFNRHNLACGAAADATNKSTSSCPPLAAPVVARTMTPAGVELNWAAVANAVEYRIFRGELGCNRQQVPLAKLGSGQTTYTDNSRDSLASRSYRVQAFGTNRACAGPLSNCIVAPPGSRLDEVAHRVIDGDGDGVPEPGETLDLAVTLLNNGGDPSANASGTLRLVGPADVRILQPQATWPAIAPGTTGETNAPHFGIVVLEQARCGEVLTLALTGDAENSAPFSDEIRIPMGNPYIDYTETFREPIPYETPTPVEVFWTSGDDDTVAELDVSVDITHQDPTQLVVELISPRGTRVRLHDRGPVPGGRNIQTRYDRDTVPSGPGSMTDFVGEPLAGVWTLSVQDVDPSGSIVSGSINARTLHATIAGGLGCTPQACAEPAPTAAPNLSVTVVPAGPDLDLVLSWTPVAGAGYHVLQSVDKTFRAVDLIGTTTTATTFSIENGAHTTPAVTFFEVRAINSCHQEGP